MSRLSGILQAFAAAFLLAVPVSSQTPAALGEKGAVIADTGGEVVVTIALSRPVPWTARVADAPPRLIVGLHDVVWDTSPKVSSGSIVAVSAERSGADTTEMVAILREPLAIATAEMQAREDDTAELTIRLQATTATVFREELEDQVFSGPDRMVVALDPGHGGFDPGAEAAGQVEADLVLQFARRMKTVLEATGRFDVVLTREADVFVSLEERLSVARAAGAEVFLSLHADAIADADAASGLVVYSLDPDAGDAASRRLTEQHGADDLLTGVDLTGAGDDVSLALLSLARADTAPRAAALSGSIVGAFQGAGLAVNSRPERLGEFSVLKAADIPSLLVELGFLSTDEDLARLTSEAWQADAAAALRDGIALWAEEDRLR